MRSKGVKFIGSWWRGEERRKIVGLAETIREKII